MSKDRKIEDSNKKEFWDYPKNNIQCRRMFRANAWIMGVKWEYPEFISTAALNLKLDVENNGPLSSDFDKGKKKLIPIVFISVDGCLYLKKEVFPLVFQIFCFGLRS